MAFCTTCGANVPGAFCTSCGTPVKAAASQQAPPPAAAPAFQPPPAVAPVAAAPVAAAPAKRGLSPIAWILIIVGGLIVLSVLAVVGAGLFVVHKVHQAGFDSAEMQRNPGYAAAKMIIAMNPDAEEVSHDESSGTITVRDKKTGKVTTMSFGDVKNGHFSFSAQDENGKTGTVEFGGGSDALGNLPSWVPMYPGAKAEGTFSAKGGESGEEGGTVAFATSDDASKVLAFYRDKGKDLGMKTNMTTSSAEGGMLMFADENSKRTLMVTVGGSGGHTSIGLTYAEKK
jgi:hypothetical protein